MIKAKIDKTHLKVSAKGGIMTMLTELIVLASDILKQIIEDAPEEIQKALKQSFIETLIEVI